MAEAIAHHRNKRVAMACAMLISAMGGLAYAAVPLYDLLCRVTGLNGTTQFASAAPAETGVRRFEVTFDVNVEGGLPWRFAPEVSGVTVKSGEARTITYRISNASARETTGIARFNVTPSQAGAYFNKIQCFCEAEQTLKAGESREETLTFFIDPAIDNEPGLARMTAITLSYTFLAVKPPPKPLASAAAPGKI